MKHKTWAYWEAHYTTSYSLQTWNPNSCKSNDKQTQILKHKYDTKVIFVISNKVQGQNWFFCWTFSLSSSSSLLPSAFSFCFSQPPSSTTPLSSSPSSTTHRPHYHRCAQHPQPPRPHQHQSAHICSLSSLSCRRRHPLLAGEYLLTTLRPRRWRPCNTAFTPSPHAGDLAKPPSHHLLTPLMTR